MKHLAVPSRPKVSTLLFYVGENSMKQIAVGSRPNFSCSLKNIHQILQRCHSMKQLKQLHAPLTTAGLLADTLVAAAVVAFCSVSGDLCYGRRLFDRFPIPNRFMWNSLIRGYSNSDRPAEAFVLFRSMLGCRILPNDFTLPFVLKSCARESDLATTLSVHALVFKLGFESQVFVVNTLLHAYTSCGSLRLAHKVFDESRNTNVVSWNFMINGYSKMGDCKKAFGLFRAMKDSGFEPDGFTLVSLLSGCSQAGTFDLGRRVHHYMVITGVGVDLILGNVLLDMYGKGGDLSSARLCFDGMSSRNMISWTSMVCAHASQGLIDPAKSLFDRMPERCVVSWNTMISSYVRQGLFREGVTLFNHMLDSGVVPDATTLVIVLSACGQIGDLIAGQEIHDYIRKHATNPSITLLNSMVDMYAKCGPIGIALDLFTKMS